jgi:hypothetical protein
MVKKHILLLTTRLRVERAANDTGAKLSCSTHVVLLGRREPAVVVADKRRLISPARTGRLPLLVLLIAWRLRSYRGLV